MYVTKADYRGRISTGLLDMIISEDPTGIIANASKDAEDTILSLAGVLYDVVPEFAKTATARNFYVLKLAINISLYNIYQIADDETIPEKVIKNYDDTINDLTKISIGKMTLNLPPNSTDNSGGSGSIGGDETASTTGNGLRRIGSAPKRTHRI
jgi:hypothetical protein